MTFGIQAWQAEALGGPFVLWVTADDQVVVDRPTEVDLMRLAGGRVGERLDLLAGSAAATLRAAVAAEDFAVVTDLVDDMQAFFGYAQAARLVWLVDRYGQAIERDLSYFHHVDLLDVLRGHITPRAALGYIDWLPPFSAFSEESAQDDELAEMLATDEDAPTPQPRLREWTPERGELVNIHEAVRDLEATVAAVFSEGSSERPRRRERPETALDRLAARMEDAAYDYLLERIDEARAGDVSSE